MSSCMGSLKVDVVEGRNLSNMDGMFGKNDAYVIVKVKNQKHKTNIIAKGGKNPVWNESFYFTVSAGDEVEVEVYDYDKIKDDLIGSVKIPLTEEMKRAPLDCSYALSRAFQPKGQYPEGANIPQ
ncbi:Extended synaptotagmin-3 [Massospora cicadina]|nr:Extended synaptotagmin-3 [Massospora cicadina]